MGSKLTRLQREMLDDAVNLSGTSAAGKRGPVAISLVRRGLLTPRDPRTCRYYLTPAGRAALVDGSEP